MVEHLNIAVYNIVQNVTKKCRHFALTFALFCDLITLLFKKVGEKMERRDFIIGILVKTGFRTSLKGFKQFCRCVELYSDDSTSTIESIYEIVARDFNCTKSSIEKNLRRLFSSSDACNAIGKLFDIDFPEAGNKEIVAMFSNYIDLRRDCYAL